MEGLRRRTHTCGDLRASDAGSEVVLQGWVQTVRDKGGLLFLLLRDRYGSVQVTLDERCDEAAWEDAKKARQEYVFEVVGTVMDRQPGAVNADMATGEIEVVPSTVRLLSSTRPLPFTITDEVTASEETRLIHRYLDLRRPTIQGNLIIRHKAAQAARRAMDAMDFIEVETPVLTRSTPEGARDYLVPSRVHPGAFFALPQSPQIFKQLLMVAGLDRYFQIVKCFRDEDLRADRQPEFTQIDIEMSFATRELVREVTENLVRAVWSDVRGLDVPEIPQLTWQESMDRFGVDNPDLRFDLEHQTLDWAGT